LVVGEKSFLTDNTCAISIGELRPLL